jgi:Phage integrase, N-terminal SAM-like domain
MTDKAVSPLRQRMIEDMTLRHFAEKAQKDYIRYVKTFAAFLGRSPDTATAEDPRLYQLHTTKSRVSPPSINAAILGRQCPCRKDRDRSRIGRSLNRLVRHGSSGNPVGSGFCTAIAVVPSHSMARCVYRNSRRARGRCAWRWKRHYHDPAIFLERHRSPIDRAQIPSRRRFADMETNEALGRFVVEDRDIPGSADRGSR